MKKFSVTHHAGQATTTQLGQRAAPFRLMAMGFRWLCSQMEFLERSLELRET